MKNLFPALLLCCSWVPALAQTALAQTALAQTAQVVTLTPTAPSIGDTVRISYNPAAPGAYLSGDGPMEVVELRYGSPFDVFPMERVGATWQTQYPVYEGTSYVRFIVRSGESVDGGGDRGFDIMIHDRNGTAVRNAYYMRALSHEDLVMDLEEQILLQMADLRRELALHPDNISARSRLWSLLLDDGEDPEEILAEAKPYLEAYWAESRGTYNGLTFVTQVYRMLGLMAEGEAFKAEALAADPDCEAAVGVAFFELMKEEARPDFLDRLETFLEDHPEPAVEPSYFYYILFNAYQAVGRGDMLTEIAAPYAATQRFYRSRIHREIALALVGTGGDLDEALSYAQKAQALEDQEPVGRVRVLNEEKWLPTYVEPAVQDEARDLLEGKNSAALGMVYLARGEQEAALAPLKRAATLMPLEASVIFRLGEAYLTLNRAEEAVAVYRDLAINSPDDEAVQARLQGAYMQAKGSMDGYEGVRSQLEAAWSVRPAPVYTVGVYETDRDPAADLAATVAQAQASGKRILLDIGGEWCSWCHALDRFWRQNETVAAVLQEHFLIMKVNFSPENENRAFLSDYPRQNGYPHLYVLERDGTLLHSQPSNALEAGSSYSERAMMKFLTAWAPGISP